MANKVKSEKVEQVDNLKARKEAFKKRKLKIANEKQGAKARMLAKRVVENNK